MTEETAARIVPGVTPLTGAYWAAAERGVILLQHCVSCGVVVHPPTPVCPGSDRHDLHWFEASGLGRLASFTSVEHAAHPAVRARLPYLVALIDLDEGPRLICNLVTPDPAALSPGARVAFRLGQAAGGLELPVAHLAADHDSI